MRGKPSCPPTAPEVPDDPDRPLYLDDRTLHAIARRIADLSAAYLAGLGAAPAYPSEPAASDDLIAAQAGALPEEALGERALEDLGRVLESCRAPTSRFFGYILGSGEPVAALADGLASVLNQNVTAWRSSPAGVTLEKEVVRWIAALIGCGDFSGYLCGGGSSANLMGLAMARESRLPANEAGARAGVIYASSEVHMSIPKAVALLGLGRRNLTLVPVNDRFEMDVGALEAAIAADLCAGRTPLAVVATAGTVNTGAIDPLQAIAAICARHDLWLHVDGAYGALAASVQPEKFSSLARADSLSLDGHKWLYQPVDCGILLFQRATDAVRAFRFSADYAQPLETDPLQSFAFFDQSLELSRRFRALKVWLSLRYHGLKAYRASIRADLRHALQLAELVRSSSALELLAEPALSVVCFRHRPVPGEDADAFNRSILKRVIERGRVYLSNATVRGQFALRACFVNHRTRDGDVRLIASEVTAAAADLEHLQK